MISEFGRGLKIVINCKGILEHDWMSCLCWYSINKNLPDAKISLICERGNMVFKWPYKAGQKVIYYTSLPQIDSEGLFVMNIPPTILAVRPYMSDNAGPVDVKSDLLTTFVDYSQGFGKASNLPKGYPKGASQYRDTEMSANEVKIIKLLENCENVYGVLI